MPEQIKCPSCGTKLRLPENLLGKIVKCPKCQTSFTAAVDEPVDPEGIVSEPVPPARKRPPAREEPDEEEAFHDDDEANESRGRRRGRGKSRMMKRSELKTSSKNGHVGAGESGFEAGMIPKHAQP